MHNKGNKGINRAIYNLNNLVVLSIIPSKVTYVDSTSNIKVTIISSSILQGMLFSYVYSKNPMRPLSQYACGGISMLGECWTKIYTYKKKENFRGFGAVVVTLDVPLSFPYTWMFLNYNVYFRYYLIG